MRASTATATAAATSKTFAVIAPTAVSAAIWAAVVTAIVAALIAAPVTLAWAIASGAAGIILRGVVAWRKILRGRSVGVGLALFGLDVAFFVRRQGLVVTATVRCVNLFVRSLLVVRAMLLRRCLFARAACVGQRFAGK